MRGLGTAAALLALALAAALPAPTRAAADPFYLGLLRDGRIAYDRGDYTNAVKDLRLACFGLLDDPQALTDCLVRLAVAQGAGSDAAGFRETFRRLAEVEDRFGAYGKAPLPPELRTAFEQKLVLWIPAATLETIPVWKPLLRTKAEVEIAALPPKERRKDLDARLDREPRNVTWNLLAAELDLDEGKTERAIARAEQTVALAREDPRTTCLRGLARAYGHRCPEALSDLEPCPLAVREARYATALLGCRVELEAWKKAADQLQSLSPALRSDKRIAALADQVAEHSSGPPTPSPAKPAEPAAGPAPKPAPAPATEKTAAKTSPEPPAAPAGKPVQVKPAPAPPAAPAMGTMGTTATPAAPTAPAAVPAPFSLAQREAMDRARRLLAANAPPKDLKESLRLAQQVAAAHPESREAQYLAGEAAYRNSRWTEAVAAFRRAGEPGDDRPDLLFYLAVSLYEMGDQPAAIAVLKRSLPHLQKSPFVDSYARRITGGTAGAAAQPPTP